MHPAANCDEICRAKSPVKMSRMVQRLSDKACGFGLVAHLRRAVEINQPLPAANSTAAIISANGSRRVFLHRAVVCQLRGATPAPSF